jgi:hypothetical protein
MGIMMLFVLQKPRQEINEIILWLGKNLGEDWKIANTSNLFWNGELYLGFVLAPIPGKAIHDKLCHLREINHPILNSNVKTLVTFEIPNDKALLFKLKFC